MSYGNHSNDFLLIECQSITLLSIPTSHSQFIQLTDKRWFHPLHQPLRLHLPRRHNISGSQHIAETRISETGDLRVSITTLLFIFSQHPRKQPCIRIRNTNLAYQKKLHPLPPPIFRKSPALRRMLKIHEHPGLARIRMRTLRAGRRRAEDRERDTRLGGGVS